MFLDTQLLLMNQKKIYKLNITLVWKEENLNKLIFLDSHTKFDMDILSVNHVVKMTSVHVK
jgi:hypothetical protein